MALTDTRRPPAPVTRRGRPVRVNPHPPAWARAALLVGAFAAAFGGLHVVLQGSSWWFVAAIYVAAVLFAAATARAVLRRRGWASLVALVTGVMLLTLGYAADTALLGVVPTPATLQRFGELVAAGSTSIVEQRVPASPELGIVFLLAVLAVACAWLSDLVVAFGRPALAALPLAAVLTVPMAVKPGLTDGFWFLLTAIAFLAILRLGRPRDSRRAVLVTGAVVVVGSLVLPVALPAVDDDDRTVTSGFRAGLNPLINLGDDLRRGNPTEALRYTTADATEPVYLRLTTLETFTGDTWGPRVTGDSSDDLDAFPAPAGLTAATATTPASVDVTVANVLSSWLPTPYPATRVTGLEGDGWYLDPQTLSVRSSESGARGQEYTAEYLQLAPTTAQLEAATTAGAEGATGLPATLPAIISDTAAQVTAGAASPYDQALALQSYLRGEPFEYSEETPVDEGFDGTGMDALAVFLDKKTGYCVHYASAMAVMARVLGIPSRIAVGFQPGERRLEAGRIEYVVSTDDLHAWPELYFDGIGWLRFEPTPGRGAVPDYGDAPVDDPNTPEDESSPTPTSSASAAPDARPERDETPQTPTEAAAQQSASVLGWLGALAVLVVLALVPAAFRAGIRRMRVRRMRRGPDPAVAAWEEVRDTARDVGWSAPDSETPRAFADRLADELAGDAALGSFRRSVESSAYGRPDAPPPSPDELAAVRRALLRSSDLRTRLRAFLLPPSLVHRWRPGGE